MRGHRIEIVFTEKDYRQPVECCQIQRLIGRAILNGAVAKKAHRDMAGLAHFFSQSIAHGVGHVAANNRV